MKEYTLQDRDFIMQFLQDLKQSLFDTLQDEIDENSVKEIYQFFPSYIKDNESIDIVYNIIKEENYLIFNDTENKPTEKIL